MKLKKIAVVILFALIFQVFGAFPVNAGENSDSDVISPALKEASELLNKLGFFDGYGKEYFSLDRELTKAELCTLIVKVINRTDLYIDSSEGEYIFEDVPRSHWAADSIYILKSLGVISGDGYGRFFPEQYVTSAQTVKMLVCALGYDVVAKHQGGWPNGYINAARSMGMFKGFKNSETTTYGDFVMLVYNSLDTAFLKSDYSNGELVYKEDDDADTILTIRDIYKTKGQITANEHSSLIPGYSTAPKKSVIINGETYSVGETDIDKYLGYVAEVYYEDADENTVLAFNVKTEEALTVNAEDIENSTATIKQIQYYKPNGGLSRAKIADGAVLIYNGVATPIDVNLLCPSVGEVVFIDSGAIGKSDGYDVVVVTEYRHFLVDGISEDGIIYIKNGLVDGNKWLDAEDADIYKNGILQGLESITPNNIISVLKSIDSSYIVIDILDISITGTVDFISPDDRELTVDGKQFKMSKEFSIYGDAGLNVGSSGDFYLDRYGNVFFFISNRDSINYGFMFKSKYNRSENVFSIRILTAGSKTETLEMADKVRVVNYPTKGATTKISTYELPDFADNYLNNTLFIYELNDEGKIRKLELPVSGSIYGGSDYFTLDCTIDASSRYAYGRIGQLMLNSATKHFSIVESNGSFDELNSKVHNGPGFAAGSSYGSSASPIYFYNVERSGVVGAVLEIKSASEKGLKKEEWPVVLVSRKYKTINSDDEVVDGIVGYANGAETDWIVSENVGAVNGSVKNIDDAKAGDLMIFETDLRGAIDTYRFIYDIDNHAEGPLFVGGSGYANIWSSATTLFGGHVYYVDNKAMRLCYNGNQFITFNFSGNYSVYKYDSSTKKCSLADIKHIKCAETADCSTNSYVVIQANRNNINTIVIYD